MNQEIDTRACKRLLTEIAELCDHASLTGSMSTGAKRTAERYNAVLAKLTEAGQVAPGLFSPVPDSADFGEVGVEARMLSGFLGDDSKNKDRHRGRDHDGGERSVIIRLAPFIGQAELNQLVREHTRSGAGFDVNTITALAPFLGQEYLSELVRENLLTKEKEASPSTEVTSNPNLTPERLETNETGVGHLLDMLQDQSLSDREREHVIERIRIATGG
jgi:hypothetical protein